MSEALRQLIEDLDLDIDLDDDDEIEEIDLADKDLETVPDCIFELKDCTTLALESKFFFKYCKCIFFKYCNTSIKHCQRFGHSSEHAQSLV